jgi:hypothetical protein
MTAAAPHPGTWIVDVAMVAVDRTGRAITFALAKQSFAILYKSKT